jgi:hypothetical protein
MANLHKKTRKLMKLAGFWSFWSFFEPCALARAKGE